MQKHVDGVGTCRVQAKDLAIESMGEPGDRMPVCCRSRAKSPNHCFPGESGADLGIIGDIDAVVEIEERCACDRVVECDCSQNEQKAKNQSLRSRTLKNGRLSRLPVVLLLRQIRGFHFHLTLNRTPPNPRFW